MELSLTRTLLRISLFFFILFGLHCAVDDEKVESLRSQIVFGKYHIPEGLKNRLDREISLMIENGNYIERIGRYIQNPDNSADKGNPNLIVLERIGSANRWSLLCLCVDKGIGGLVDLLRQNEADENYRDSYGITPLHRAAFHGHMAITQSLLRPMGDSRKKANVLIMDDSGLTARDYLRIALIGNIHGGFDIDNFLKTAEEYELEDRKNQSAQFKSFINAFMNWSTSNIDAEKILKTGKIARANNILSLSNLLSILSNTAPSGVSTVLTLAGTAASAIEGYKADQETEKFLDRASGIVMDREFVKLTYYLADMCKESIQALSPTEAGRLGKHAAKYVAEYIKRMDPSRSISFIEQVEQYFSTIKDPGYGYRKELDKGGEEKWYVHAVLKRDAEKTLAAKARRAGIGTLISSAAAKKSSTDEEFDAEEVARIELLLWREEMPVHTSQAEGDIPPLQLRSTEAMLSLQGTASENSRIIGLNGPIDNAQVRIDTTDAARAIEVNASQINTRDGVSISAVPSFAANRGIGRNTTVIGNASGESMIVMVNAGTIDNF